MKSRKTLTLLPNQKIDIFFQAENGGQQVISLENDGKFGTGFVIKTFQACVEVQQ